MLSGSCASFIVFAFIWTRGNSQIPRSVIDVDDILSEDFMPGALFVLENPIGGINTFNESIKRLEKPLEKPPDGSFGNAIETLNFHRSMMNQYLCRNYIAEQIISDMTTSRIRRRMGHVTPEAETTKTNLQLAIQNNLLNDEGSSGYKDWLSKSTTLEDIYRHYNQAQKKVDDFIEEDEKDEDFDEEYNGHVSGYMYSNDGHGVERPAKHREHTGLGMYYAGGGGYPYPNAVYNNGGGSGYHGGGSGYQHGGGSGYHQGGNSGYNHGGSSDHGDSGGYSYQDHGVDGDEGHSAYGGVHAIHEHEHVYHSYPPKYHGHQEESYSSKEHDLADLFDIALTALAFLSFGMFIVHVIMCISAASNHATTTAASMMMPMSMGPTSTGTGGMMTSTGNGGGGMTAMGGGGSNTGTGGGATSTGSEPTNTGADGGDNDGAGTGGDSMGTADGSTGGGMGDGDTDMGGGTADTGDAGTGGGGTDDGGGSTGGTSPGTATGTGDGTTDEGDGATDMDTTGTGGGTDTTGAEGDTGAGRDTFKFRLKRDIPTITNPNNQVLNELARKVLVSIEAALVANNDKGVCLRKSLCENNKFSRTLEGRDKLIIPMWSLGMSWLSGRLVKDISPATSMLDTLKASILGLGKANCEIIYQDCDLRREVTARRRRKRSTS